MSKDTIYREDVEKALNEWVGSSTANIFQLIDKIPSVERPRGEWIGYEVPSECSVCGHCWDEYVFGQEIWYDGSVPNYCPNCGARMKGVEDESS